MASFDVVSEVDLQEVSNAVDQANREIGTRYDFRGVEARFERNESEVKLTAEADIQLEQMLDVLRSKLIKRSVDAGVMEIRDPEHSGKLLHQVVLIKQGIDTLLAKKIVKMVKEQKMKVQAAIQGDQLRITSPSKDQLQEVMTFIRGEDYGVELKFGNYR